MPTPTRYPPPPAPVHPVELFDGRLSINWDYLVDRRPRVLATSEDLPGYLLLPEVNQILDVSTHARTHLLLNSVWHTGARISEPPQDGRKNTPKCLVPNYGRSVG